MKKTGTYRHLYAKSLAKDFKPGQIYVFLHIYDHISAKEFREINWLNINDRFEQCVSVASFNFFKNQCPSYMSDIFKPVTNRRGSTRNSYLKLSQPFMKTNQGQNSLSYIGPSVWNKLPEKIKKDSNNVNGFKHNIKKYYMNNLK